MTQYHLIPSSTKLYWPSTTMYQPVPPHTDSVSYIFFYDSFYECCLRKAIFVAFHFDPIKIRFLSLVKSKSSLAERLVPHWDLSQGGPIKKDTLHQKPFGWRPSSKLRTIPGRAIERKKRHYVSKGLGLEAGGRLLVTKTNITSQGLSSSPILQNVNIQRFPKSLFSLSSCSSN